MGKSIQTIYMAGPLFTAAERVHNIRLAGALRAYGYNIILPQKDTNQFFPDGRFDLHGTCAYDLICATNYDLVLANIDGPDADSGTCVEVGAAMASHIKVLCVRTDIRTDTKSEVGVNGMLQLADRIIYKPALFTDLTTLKIFYEELVEDIVKYIRELEAIEDAK